MDLATSRHRRRPSLMSAIWLVPLLAAGVTGVIVHHKLAEGGPVIEISFHDAEGLQADKSELIYRGVPMGTVQVLSLSPDHKRIVAAVRLDNSAKDFAREGSKFWLVRPRLSAGGVSGLGTLITGPYIAGSPGKGEPGKTFEGLEAEPATDALRSGMEIVLTSDRVGTLDPGTPLFYRGIRVGAVSEVALADDARSVCIRTSIERPYKSLVRKDSQFWNAGGVDLKFGLLKGATISAKSLSTLFSGGIEFASPDKPGPPAADGQAFPLNAEPKKEWLKWAPKFDLPPRPPVARQE
jgi:paraquat-inducible protein B